jgi:uncharacterized protein YcbX
MASTAPRLERLARYPVKACAPELLDEVSVGVAGLRNDRVLAVVVDGQVVTQRELPVLSRVQPRLDDISRRLELSLRPTDGAEPRACVTGTVELDGAPETVTLFGDEVAVVAQDAVFAEWLSELLQQPARLVAAPETTRRPSPGLVEGLTVLADQGTVSLHARASVDLLNEALAERGEPPLGADRFRANLVVDGWPAHAEDRVRRVTIGEVVLGFEDLDPRCVVTTVDQDAGVKAGPEPIRTLAGYRRHAGGVSFGVYLAVERPGVLRVGDPVSAEHR